MKLQPTATLIYLTMRRMTSLKFICVLRAVPKYLLGQILTEITELMIPASHTALKVLINMQTG